MFPHKHYTMPTRKQESMTMDDPANRMVSVARTWRNSIVHSSLSGKSDEKSLKPFASTLLKALLAPQRVERRPKLAEDLVVVRKAVDALLEAVDDGTIDEHECAAVLKLLTANFTSRRLESIFERISEAPKTSWFLTTHHRRSHG